jgi:hypothetical protein
MHRRVVVSKLCFDGLGERGSIGRHTCAFEMLSTNRTIGWDVHELDVFFGGAILSGSYNRLLSLSQEEVPVSVERADGKGHLMRASEVAGRR